ncbi:hypothetical protein [Paludisphaera soli]|uniref:hypothetical protein n=1 Tax=Paludisphaera soli TaxID=2712865 RepID=UPI0013EC40FA|nr:hypothetical protein [Paludisphaera soli]
MRAITTSVQAKPAAADAIATIQDWLHIPPTTAPISPAQTGHPIESPPTPEDPDEAGCCQRWRSAPAFQRPTISAADLGGPVYQPVVPAW